MQLHYIQKGSGNTALIFLHYFGGSSATWDEVIDILKDSFHCIAIDLLGFGNSPAPDTDPLTVSNSADAVVQLIHHLQLKQYILIGHSMGGKTALDIAAGQPEGLTQLVLIAPSPPTPEPISDAERKEMTEAFGKRKAVEKMITAVTASPLPATVFNREVAHNLRVSSVAWHSWPQWGSKEDLSAKMKDIKAPVAISGGAADKKFTRDFLQHEFNRYFNNVQVHEVPGAGHLLPVEAPAATAEWINRLVKG